MNDIAGGETEDQQRRRLYDAHRAELLERQRSNSESYDKAILTLSSGALGLSLTFIKDLLPTSKPLWMGVLYGSWMLLTAAIITTVASFLLSSAAINQAIEQGAEYYLHKKGEAFARTKLSIAVDAINYTSGAFFVVGILLTVLFVRINFSEARSMKDSKTGTVSLSSGHAVPRVQKIETVELKRGQSIPHMQEVIPSKSSATSEGSSQGSAATASQSAAQVGAQSAAGGAQTAAAGAAQTEK